MYVILLGAPGAGKGTQAALLSQKLGMAHVATGDLFRQAVEKGTELGKLAKTYMEKGKLVPDEITIRMVQERISAPDCSKGIILDGFPRNLEQAKALDIALKAGKKGIDRVAYIEVSREELLKRLSERWICRNCQTPYNYESSAPRIKGKCDKCGGELYQRPDDKVETIKKRLEVYFTETAPLIDYYSQSKKLVTIKGEGKAEEINEKISAALKLK